MIAIQEVYMRSFFLATPASDRADPTPEAHSTGVVGTFSYRRSGTNRWRRMRLDPMEFIRRFLQHVLPRGLQKVRHYLPIPGTAEPALHRSGPGATPRRWELARALETGLAAGPCPGRGLMQNRPE